MTPKKLATEIESKSLKAIDRLNKVIISTQEDAYGRVTIVLKDLALNKNGYIIQNAENRGILREANKAFAKAIESAEYVSGLNQFTVMFTVIDDLNVEYFTSLDNFSANKQFMKSLQKQAIAEIESTLLNEGLESQIKQPLSRILNQNINSGGSYTGMVEQVKDYIKGTDTVDGKLLKHSKTITKDILFNYSRTYQSAVASDLDLEFYLYVGGVMDTTRPFCEHKAGQYFHHKEIEQWAKQDWAGKRPGTTESSIFTYAGGYNCLHQILPVSEIVVPVEVKERASKAGYYKAKTPVLVEA